MAKIVILITRKAWGIVSYSINLRSSLDPYVLLPLYELPCGTTLIWLQLDTNSKYITHIDNYMGNLIFQGTTRPYFLNAFTYLLRWPAVSFHTWQLWFSNLHFKLVSSRELSETNSKAFNKNNENVHIAVGQVIGWCTLCGLREVYYSALCSSLTNFSPLHLEEPQLSFV